MRDAQYYKDRLAELEAILRDNTPNARNADQLVESRDYCERRIGECLYQDEVERILNSN